MPPGGYYGRYLRVDLTAGAASFVPIPEAVLRRYLGGVGLGTWLLLREAPPGADPLSPEAPLIFALSPLVGTPLTTSAKFAVVAKSPLTFRINDALSSSHFAIAAKRAGLDALVVAGARRAPSVLIIDGARAGGRGPGGARAERGAGARDAPPAVPAVRIDDGSDLWGLSASQAERRLKGRLRRTEEGDLPFHTAAIGIAGENLVRFATVSNDGRHAGRGGLGAVMGSKRLKAIAVRGRRFVPLSDPESVNAAAKDLSARSFGPATEKYRELGTVANLLVFNRLAVLPTRNFQESTFEGAEALSPERLAAMRTRTRSSCAACTIGCEHVYGVRREEGGRDPGGAGGGGRPAPQGGEDLRAGGRGVRLEYESLFALGPLCGIDEPDAVLEAAALCDELGLDTISAGGTIAFAMECAGRGLIRAAGLPAPLSMRFGDAACVLELIRLIARREGIGRLLAEGSRRAAESIGGDAPRFAAHVKGLEIPGYEPRALQAMGLGFAVGSRGADHNRSGAYEVDFSEAADRFAGDAGSARRAVETEDRSALMDSLILCKFLRGIFGDLFEEAPPLLRAVTGWEVTAAELRETARRIVAARKWFNEREGWTPAEDTLPERFLTESLRRGASAGAVLSRRRLAEMIEAYNLERGFTPDGRVPEPLRRRLGIEL
ncbi:MAG: aldehyde ferredoxin oxidoreductase family protein [Acidobacteriota bacterium]